MDVFKTLFIVFIILKLCKVIDWSWWWITAPIWGALLLAIMMVLLTLLAEALD